MSSGKTPNQKEQLEVYLKNILVAAKALEEDPANDAQNNKLLGQLRSFLLTKAPAEMKQSVLKEMILGDNKNIHLIQFVLSNLPSHFLVDPQSLKNINKLLSDIGAPEAKIETGPTHQFMTRHALPMGTLFKPIPKGEEATSKWLKAKTPPGARQPKEESEKKALDLPASPTLPRVKK